MKLIKVAAAVLNQVQLDWTRNRERARQRGSQILIQIRRALGNLLRGFETELVELPHHVNALG